LSNIEKYIRTSTIIRKSNETDISIKMNIDDKSQDSINTGWGMLDHMLTLLSFWGGINVQVQCQGDMHIDAHHTAEDIGMCLGKALRECLHDCKGINRVGYGRVPMDEALADVTIDISGRPWLEWRGDDLLPAIIAGQEKDLWREFFKAFASTARINLHISFLYGKNGHHLLESVFKGLGLALAQAIQKSSNCVRSTKGGLD